MAAAAAEKIARDDQSGQALAEDSGLEYLKASAVSVDPRALSLLERDDCRRLRAIPLAAGSGGALVAVSSPSEERFDAIRELTGEQTRFVLINEGTLDALLGSRMFADAPAKASTPAGAAAKKAPASEKTTAPEQAAEKAEGEAAVTEEPVAADDAATPESAAPPAPPAEKDAPAPDAAVDDIVSAVLTALKHRIVSEPESAPVETPAVVAPAVATAQPASAATAALPASTEELLTHVDATVETWSALRATLASLHTEFEETKRALRETKEQLSVAHADNDQYRKQIRTLEGELTESRDLVGQARTRLQEAAELLEADPIQLREPAELL